MHVRFNPGLLAPSIVLTAVVSFCPGAAEAGTIDFGQSHQQSLARQAESLASLHSMVVLHDGEVALELDIRGPGLSAPVNIKSLSKTVLSVLAGIALERGLIESVDQPLVELLGPRVPANATAGVEAITLGHALSLRAGLPVSGNHSKWLMSAVQVI